LWFCGVLNVPDRREWKQCMKSEAEEKAMAQAFRKGFAPFDFTRKKK
jgi:anti-sigma-K factor RskA